MSKRILSLLLALVMVIGMIVPAVYADETENTQATEKTLSQIGDEIAAAANAMEFPETLPAGATGVTKYCPVCGEDALWKPIKTNATNWIGAGTTGNHLYVPTDISVVSSTLSEAAGYALLESAGELCLHLNGKTVEVKGSKVFNFGREYAANIMGNGTVCGSPQSQQTSTLYITSGATVNLYGGTYKKGADASIKAPVLQMGKVNSGTLNIYGTTEINGSGIANEETPGCIFLAQSNFTINMYGGTITNGKSVSSTGGGNIFVKDGQFNMYGGEITGGIQANSTKANSFGGNVHVGSTGKFTLDGGKISKGKANSGGNVYVSGGEFVMKSGTLEGFGSSTTIEYGGNISVKGGICTIDGGAITKGYAAYRGGNIYAVESGSAEITINGGTISKGYASAGGNLCAFTPVTINGATIQDGTHGAGGGGNIYVKNTTVTCNDATVTNGTITLANAAAKLEIHHGSYSVDPASYLASGAVAVAGEGIYTVHQPVDKEASEATCTQPGKAAHVGCSGCDKAFADATCAVEIDAADATKPAHTQTPVEATPSTCTVAGNKAYFACECGKNYADEACENEIADLAAWKAGEGALELAEHAYVYEYKSATAHTVSCENCETVFEDGAHNTAADPCARCGAKKILLKIAAIQAPSYWTNTETQQIFTMGVWSGTTGVAVGYNEGIYIELYSGDTLLMTSTMAKGSYDGKAYFVLEGESELWTTVLAEGVTLSDENVPTKAVLYVDGVKTHTYTGKNNYANSIFDEAQYKAYLQMAASGHVHTLDEGVETTPASCTAPGELTKTCSVCDGTVKTPIEQLEHDWADATCTAPKTCKTCGETEGEANGHDWADATCTAAKTCKTCGETEGEANGHDWADATCTAAKTCKTCGETEGEANGHDWADATCTAPKTCKTCGETEGEAKGHAWNDATCTAPKTCGTCGATEGEANGHDWADATCTAAKTCGTCGATEGEAAGHKLTLVEEKPAQVGVAGYEAYYKCDVCQKMFSDAEGKTEIEAPVEIPALPEVEEGAFKVGDKTYETFEDVMKDYVAGEAMTVKLLKATSVAQLFVNPGVTLDLNGNTLTLDEKGALLIYNNATILDSSVDRSGRVNAKMDQVRMNHKNSYLPVDTGNGLMFVAVTSGHGMGSENGYQCWINNMDAQLAELLKTKKASELGLKFQVVITWGNSELVYTFSDDTVSKYAADWQKLAMYLKVTGAEQYSDLKYQARIAAAVVGEAAAWSAGTINHN